MNFSQIGKKLGIGAGWAGQIHKAASLQRNRYCPLSVRELCAKTNLTAGPNPQVRLYPFVNIFHSIEFGRWFRINRLASYMAIMSKAGDYLSRYAENPAAFFRGGVGRITEVRSPDTSYRIKTVEI